MGYNKIKNIVEKAAPNRKIISKRRNDKEGARQNEKNPVRDFLFAFLSQWREL